MSAGGGFGLPPSSNPKAAVILTVEGQIRDCNSGLEAQFDLAMLEALPKRQVKTQNPWEAGVATYEGVLLRDLLDTVEANGTVLRIAALNDYRADIDVADTQSIDVILAYKRNGEYMPVREKGPLFVVFPFSDEPSLAVKQRYRAVGLAGLADHGEVAGISHMSSSRTVQHGALEVLDGGSHRLPSSRLPLRPSSGFMVYAEISRPASRRRTMRAGPVFELGFEHQRLLLAAERVRAWRRSGSGATSI